MGENSFMFATARLHSRNQAAIYRADCKVTALGKEQASCHLLSSQDVSEMVSFL
jgi:hypothetical protein